MARKESKVRYRITTEDFELVAAHVTLADAAALVGAFPSAIVQDCDDYGNYCQGRYIVEREEVSKWI